MTRGGALLFLVAHPDLFRLSLTLHKGYALTLHKQTRNVPSRKEGKQSMTGKERRRIVDRILAAIEASTLTRYEIARQSGVDEASLSRFVNGKSSLDLSTIEKLAPVLGLEIVVKKSSKKGSKRK